jgi:hypothetical protein
MMKAKLYLIAVILLIVIAQSMAFQDELTDCLTDSQCEGVQE